jgi:hypothetical protein
MKFSLECEVVDSHIKTGDFIISCYGKDYHFIPNETGTLSKIKIVVPAEHPEKFEMVITPQENRPELNSLKFSYDGDQVHEILTSDFQYIEGMLSLWGNIKRVNWQSARFEYLPETDEEKARIAIPWIQIEKTPDKTEREMPDVKIAQIILRRNFHGALLNQFLVFLREGKNNFQVGRYISAFLNFYFILEGAYGEKDHWRNAETREDFLKSPEFCKFVDEIITDNLKIGGRYHWWINKMLQELKTPKGNPISKPLNSEGIAWLLVDTRGSLLHFKRDFNNLVDHLRVDDDYEAIAFVAYSLATKTVNFLFDEIETEYIKIMNEREAQHGVDRDDPK